MKKLSLIFLLFILTFSSGLIAQNLCYLDSIFNISNINKKVNTDLVKEIIQKKEVISIDNETTKMSYEFLRIGKDNENSFTFDLFDKKKSILRVANYKIDGKISSVYFNLTTGDCQIFRIYHFNNEGNVREIIDYETGYKLCWEEAIEFCKKYVGAKNIKKYNIQEFRVMSRTNLNEKPNDKPIWYICPIAKRSDGSDYKNHIGDKYYKKNKGNIYYHINGATGELVGRSLYWSDDGMVVKRKDLK